MIPDRPTRIPTREELLSDYTEKPPQRDPSLIYFGMTRDEIADGIRQNPTVLPHYLGRMGEYGFAYYFPAFADYLYSECARGDAWNLLMLHNIVTYRMDVMKSDFPACREEVVASVHYCASNLEKFAVNALLNQDADTEHNYEPEIGLEFNLLLERLTNGRAAGAPAQSAPPRDPPGLCDITPTLGLDLDERSALQSFYGKTQPEAEALFHNNPARYASELPWMGPQGFSYYFRAYTAYLKSPQVATQPDDFDQLESILSIHSGGNLTEWKTNTDVLDLFNYAMELLRKPKHARHYESIKLRERLEKLLARIMG